MLEGLPQHGDIPVSVFPCRVCSPSQGEQVPFWDLNVRMHLIQFSSPKLTKPVIICVWPVWVLDRSSSDNFVLSGCPGIRILQPLIQLPRYHPFQRRTSPSEPVVEMMFVWIPTKFPKSLQSYHFPGSQMRPMDFEFGCLIFQADCTETCHLAVFTQKFKLLLFFFPEMLLLGFTVSAKNSKPILLYISVTCCPSANSLLVLDSSSAAAFTTSIHAQVGVEILWKREFFSLIMHFY